MVPPSCMLGEPIELPKNPPRAVSHEQAQHERQPDEDVQAEADEVADGSGVEVALETRKLRQLAEPVGLVEGGGNLKFPIYEFEI